MPRDTTMHKSRLYRFATIAVQDSVQCLNHISMIPCYACREREKVNSGCLQNSLQLLYLTFLLLDLAQLTLWKSEAHNASRCCMEFNERCVRFRVNVFRVSRRIARRISITVERAWRSVVNLGYTDSLLISTRFCLLHHCLGRLTKSFHLVGYESPNSNRNANANTNAKPSINPNQPLTLSLGNIPRRSVFYHSSFIQRRPRQKHTSFFLSDSSSCFAWIAISISSLFISLSSSSICARTCVHNAPTKQPMVMTIRYLLLFLDLLLLHRDHCRRGWRCGHSS